ncbi:MAG: TetR family transcriptional regulator [Chloroflexota bacterium]
MPKIVDIDKNRRMIAQAACQAIAQKGISDVTMIDIADAAGVTTGMIANYFENKQAIIAAALRIPFENMRARINRQIAAGSDDLADILDVAIPAKKSYKAETAAWVSFWGLIATNDEFRRLNKLLHQEGAEIYAEAVRAAWPESTAWPENVFDQTLRSIVTFLFGLSAGGVTNPRVWTKSVQREQLRHHLTLIRDWANSVTP